MSNKELKAFIYGTTFGIVALPVTFILMKWILLP